MFGVTGPLKMIFPVWLLLISSLTIRVLVNEQRAYGLSVAIEFVPEHPNSVLVWARVFDFVGSNPGNTREEQNSGCDASLSPPSKSGSVRL